MAVPEKAYVCAYCKKRLRTSRFSQGCLILIVGAAAIAFLGKVLEPTKPPEMAKTAEEQAKSEADKKASEERARQDEAAFLKTPGGKVWQKHRDWSQDICMTIAKREIHVGMTAEQVRASWGKPSEVNATIYSHSKHEQWVYGSNQYVYFEDGVMTALQQTKR
jgi:hypothetical protein